MPYKAFQGHYEILAPRALSAPRSFFEQKKQVWQKGQPLFTIPYPADQPPMRWRMPALSRCLRLYFCHPPPEISVVGGPKATFQAAPPP